MKLRAPGICGVVLLGVLVSCGNSAITPNAVAPSWAKQSLNHEPDIVMSLDVRALKADPFFGRVVDSMWVEVPRAYDSMLGASRIDGFATVGLTYSAVIHGVGDPPAEVIRCLWPNGSTADGAYSPREEGGPWLTASSGSWVISSAQTTGPAPGPVSMDGGDTIFEAWLGPAAVDDGLRRARWDAREIWSHLYALRFAIKGGATPGFDMDARFETTVDADHAQYDLERLERYAERIGREADDSDLTKMALDQLHNIRVSRSGVNISVSYRATPQLTQYALDKLAERHPTNKRETRACAE